MIRLVFCLCSIVNLDSHIEEDFLNYKNQEWHNTSNTYSFDKIVFFTLLFVIYYVSVLPQTIAEEKFSEKYLE